jgi:hypothetical protein
MRANSAGTGSCSPCRARVGHLTLARLPTGRGPEVVEGPSPRLNDVGGRVPVEVERGPLHVFLIPEERVVAWLWSRRSPNGTSSTSCSSCRPIRSGCRSRTTGCSGRRVSRRAFRSLSSGFRGNTSILRSSSVCEGPVVQPVALPTRAPAPRQSKSGPAAHVLRALSPTATDERRRALRTDRRRVLRLAFLSIFDAIAWCANPCPRRVHDHRFRQPDLV